MNGAFVGEPHFPLSRMDVNVHEFRSEIEKYKYLRVAAIGHQSVIAGGYRVIQQAVLHAAVIDIKVLLVTVVAGQGRGGNKSGDGQELLFQLQRQ